MHPPGRRLPSVAPDQARQTALYAFAMKDRSPFGIAALWENWQDPTTREWVRTFVVLTTPSNDLVIRIHDRMPAILKPADYER